MKSASAGWCLFILEVLFFCLIYLFFALIYGSMNFSGTARWQEMPEIGLLLQNFELLEVSGRNNSSYLKVGRTVLPVHLNLKNKIILAAALKLNILNLR